jgi:Transposase IS66 family
MDIEFTEDTYIKRLSTSQYRLDSRTKQKVLRSLHNHWDGLTVFVERPEVAMDNHTAERGLRTPVVGRKNYYGWIRMSNALLPPPRG